MWQEGATDCFQSGLDQGDLVNFQGYLALFNAIFWLYFNKCTRNGLEVPDCLKIQIVE
jgi:hypothetical protein